MTIARILIALPAFLLLSACVSSSEPETPSAAPSAAGEDDSGGWFSGSDEPDEEAEEQSEALGVNYYLWSAALDTISFMPLQAAESKSGVIISDWYTAPETPGERLKVTVYILDKQLRADAVRVAVFRETKDAATGQWSPAPVEAQTARKLEDAILTRARQLRVANSG